MHARERANERMLEAGIDPRLVLAVATKVASAHSTIDLAVRLAVLPQSCGDQRDDVLSRESNGNEVWAICRGGHVVTIMLRRSTQPRTAAAFGVQRVARLGA